jgi:rhamnosyltransferase
VPDTFIVMATYNGACFLGEQIESLLRQTRRDWTLLVRDDGSSDETLAMLERLAAIDSRVRLLPSEGRRLGPSQSFGRLLDAAFRLGGERVFLCDQDDVWLPDKVARQLELLRHAEARFGRDTPMIIHSDLEVVDENLRLVHESFFASQRLKHVKKRPLHTLAVQNFVTGCTLVVNRPALEIALPIPPEAVMHDWWIALCTAGRGRLLFDPAPLVKYRQHDGNAVGARHFWRAAWDAICRRTRPSGWRIRETSLEFAAVLTQAAAAADRLADFHPPSAKWLAEFLDLWRNPPSGAKRLSKLRRLGSRRLDPLRNLLLQARLALTASK